MAEHFQIKSSDIYSNGPNISLGELVRATVPQEQNCWCSSGIIKTEEKISHIKNIQIKTTI